MKQRNELRTMVLAMDAMLAAMCAVLGYFAIDLTFIKFTFESFPVLVAALLFGPIDGVAVGLVGTFLYQFLRYGLEASTPLWILPYGVIGLICGLYAMKYQYRNTRKQIYFIVALMEFLMFALNTVSLYFYAGMIGKVGAEFVLSGILPRSLVMLMKAVGFALLMPVVLKAVHRFRRENHKKTV